MPSFLVEMYVADDPSALAEVERVARQAASLAVDVRLVRTTFLPSDELALHLFEAPSAEALGPSRPPRGPALRPNGRRARADRPTTCGDAGTPTYAARRGTQGGNVNGHRASMVIASVVVAATLVAAATAGSKATTAGASYKVVGAWGTQGTGNGQFAGNALGLATAKNGDVYIADSDSRRIQRFAANGAFKGKMSMGGDFVPDVAVDADGNLWATADTAAMARAFAPDGHLLGSVSTGKQALGIGADSAGSIYVAISSDDVHIVQRYDKSERPVPAGNVLGRLPGPRRCRGFRGRHHLGHG